jgi:MFS family permease
MFLAMLWQGASVASMRIWGSFIDRYSNKAVFRISGPLFALGLLLWTFTDEWHQAGYAVYLLPVLYIMIGLATGGTALASNNIIFKLAPRGNATAYSAAANLLIAMATALAPIIGGLLADWFVDRSLTLTLSWHDPSITTDLATFIITHWDFFFITGSMLAMIALQFVSTIDEPSTQSREPAYREVWDHLSGSVFGTSFWRHFSNWPYLLRRRRKHENDIRNQN